MKVVITSAVEKEVLLIKQKITPSYFLNDSKILVQFHESGIGILSSCFSLTNLIIEHKPDLIIQAGIAGTFDKKIPLGQVVIVREEILADMGVEEDETFKDLFDMGLLKSSLFPFTKGRLINPEIEKLNFLRLDAVTGITINEITTRLKRIEQYKLKYLPLIESMEGASLHYCCLQTSIPFIQIRAISNYVGERNKSNWKFEEAFKNLSDTVVNYIAHLSDKKISERCR